MEFLQAIEHLWPARLLKGSFFAYPIVNALHIASIGTLFTSVLLMDLATLGAIRSVAAEKLVELLRPIALGAFAFAAVTGLLLFSVQATTYAGNFAFLLKLGLIALAALNFLVFAASAHRKRSDAPPTSMRISAVLSILTWSGVLLAGRFIGYL